jgi:hypothetical protein
MPTVLRLTSRLAVMTKGKAAVVDPRQQRSHAGQRKTVSDNFSWRDITIEFSKGKSDTETQSYRESDRTKSMKAGLRKLLPVFMALSLYLCVSVSQFSWAFPSARK